MKVSEPALIVGMKSAHRMESMQKTEEARMGMNVEEYFPSESHRQRNWKRHGEVHDWRWTRSSTRSAQPRVQPQAVSQRMRMASTTSKK